MLDLYHINPPSTRLFVGGNAEQAEDVVTDGGISLPPHQPLESQNHTAYLTSVGGARLDSNAKYKKKKALYVCVCVCVCVYGVTLPGGDSHERETALGHRSTGENLTQRQGVLGEDRLPRGFFFSLFAFLATSSDERYTV